VTHRGRPASVVAGVVVIAALVVLTAPVVPASAQSPTEDMQQYTDEVVRLIRDVTVREKDTLGALQAAVARMALQIFGAPEAAREALGPHWAARTPAEQDEFTRLFAELLEATYLSQVDGIGGVKVRYVGEIVEGDRAEVRARLLGKKNREVTVDARLVRRGERWFIWDVAIGGISLIGNYRAQFDRIIRRSSYAEPVRQVAAKRDELLSRRRAPQE
jgi:phospholipid transport system substrate-binding protein